MSILATYIGAVEGGDTVDLTTTNLTVVLPGETNVIIAAAFSLVNTSGSSATVALYRNDGTTDHLFWDDAVAANSTVVVDNLPQRFKGTTQSIKAQASAGNAIKVHPILMRQNPNA